MNASLQLITNSLNTKINDLIGAAKSDSLMRQIVFPLYQQIQTARFQTQNASEGNPWEPLDPQYEEYKLKRYGGGRKRGGGKWKTWPEAGRKMLIGTSTLAGAVIGPNSGYLGASKQKVTFASQSLQVSIDESGSNAEGAPFNYPHFVAEGRPFFTFGSESKTLLKTAIVAYMAGRQARESVS